MVVKKRKWRQKGRGMEAKSLCEKYGNYRHFAGGGNAWEFSGQNIDQSAISKAQLNQYSLSTLEQRFCFQSLHELWYVVSAIRYINLILAQRITFNSWMVRLIASTVVGVAFQILNAGTKQSRSRKNNNGELVLIWKLTRTKSMKNYHFAPEMCDGKR